MAARPGCNSVIDTLFFGLVLKRQTSLGPDPGWAGPPLKGRAKSGLTTARRARTAEGKGRGGGGKKGERSSNGGGVGARSDGARETCRGAKLHILLSAASPVSAWSPCSHLYPPSPSTGSITCIAPPCTLMNGQIGQPANSPHPPTSHLTPVYFHQAENQNPSAFSQLPPLLHFPLPPSDPICLDLPNPSRDSSLSIPSPPPLTPSFPPFSPPLPPPPSSSPLLSPIHSPPPRPPSSPPSFPPHLPLPCPSPLSLSPVPLPRPSPLSLSPVPLPRPSPLSLSPVPLPCPSPPSLSPVPLPCPSPPSLSPVPLPRPSPLSLSPVPLPCPSPPSLSPVPLPRPSPLSLSPVRGPEGMERMKVPTKEGLAGRREARNGGKVMRKVTFEAP
ncbi:unnamed protein product [Closterium sp. NIES-65]|nr:unnamed protein product [Closterium sp. NIES-65]